MLGQTKTCEWDITLTATVARQLKHSVLDCEELEETTGMTAEPDVLASQDVAPLAWKRSLGLRHLLRWNLDFEGQCVLARNHKTNNLVVRILVHVRVQLDS